jgi:hypothetical protein
MKNTLKKGADPSILIEILSNKDIRNIDKVELKEIVKTEYNNYFSKTSLDTCKAIVREDIIVNNQKKRFLSKLPQDLKKFDIIAANYNHEKDIIEITLSQQKGNNASFNSSSEAKTLECMSDCFINKTYDVFFQYLPDNLNPIKMNKDYTIDLCIGMVNAVGGKIKTKNGVVIRYYSNDEYLSYLGLDINTVELAMMIQNSDKIKNHHYDAVLECKNWEDIYNKCLNLIIKSGNK